MEQVKFPDREEQDSRTNVECLSHEIVDMRKFKSEFNGTIWPAFFSDAVFDLDLNQEIELWAQRIDVTSTPVSIANRTGGRPVEGD
jgi:hypothetical protein